MNMKRICLLLGAHLAMCTGLLLGVSAVNKVAAQGMHYSQYYNAPMLQNAANTGLMSDHDYRVGANYRTQWSALIPYNTMSAYADLQVMRQKNQTSWLGVGLAFYRDKAGNGELSMTQMQALIAYHVELGTNAMLSGGFSAGYNQRSVDFNKLTFNTQWDGVTFNTTHGSGEPGGLQKTTFLDLGAGLNLAFYPNENVYIKIGGGATHINQPKETFLGSVNQLGIRPTGNVDAFFRLNEFCIVNPSVYYTYQKTASELIYGTLFSVLVGGDERSGEHLILGAYNRWNDAIIAAVGFEFDGFRLMASYDITISDLAVYNNRRGAFEIGLRWQGLYGNIGGDRRVMNCPRF
jgi:type IX secretion system PorP/SprF family membrane protein